MWYHRTLIPSFVKFTVLVYYLILFFAVFGDIITSVVIKERYPFIGVVYQDAS